MSAIHRSTIIPCMRYRDAHAAIDWLCRAFGFARQAVYEDDQGGVAACLPGNGGTEVVARSALSDRSDRVGLPTGGLGQVRVILADQVIPCIPDHFDPVVCHQNTSTFTWEEALPAVHETVLPDMLTIGGVETPSTPPSTWLVSKVPPGGDVNVREPELVPVSNSSRIRNRRLVESNCSDPSAL